MSTHHNHITHYTYMYILTVNIKHTLSWEFISFLCMDKMKYFRLSLADKVCYELRECYRRAVWELGQVEVRPEPWRKGWARALDKFEHWTARMSVRTEMPFLRWGTKFIGGTLCWTNFFFTRYVKVVVRKLYQDSYCRRTCQNMSIYVIKTLQETESYQKNRQTERS